MASSSTHESTNRLPVARSGIGSKGSKIQLYANHFRVVLTKNDGYFYNYTVSICYQDGHPVVVKGVGRKVIDKLCETYDVLKNQNFAYDGEKSLFTLCPLEHNEQEFIVVLEEVSFKRVGRDDSADGRGESSKRMRRPSQSKTYKVHISHAAKVPLRAFADALDGRETEQSQEAFRVLNIILRQNAAKQGCLIVRQSFFHDNPRNLGKVEGGVQVCRGFHSCFQATKGGLSLNVDVSNTILVKPGPVVDFLLMNQNLEHPKLIDWTKARRLLKNLRIKANNLERKITGLSEKPCRTQKFMLNHGKDANGEMQSSEITVYEYYKNVKRVDLQYSVDLPCINVGKAKRPVYLPVEFCTLVSLQRYTKALSSKQRAQMILDSRTNPQDRKAALQESLRNSKFEKEPMLRSFGITIETSCTRVDGRVLKAPTLVAGRKQNFNPQKGCWNFKDKMLADPMKVSRMIIVSFSAKCDIHNFYNNLKRCATKIGMHFDDPYIIQEEGKPRNEPASVRVGRMFRTISDKLPKYKDAQLILCILPVGENSEIYGPWKRRCLAVEGIATQCIVDPRRINDQYITNVLLKINAKLGGMSSFLLSERNLVIPSISDKPTLIIGIDVSHGSPGQTGVPSIAAVVSSRCWPQVSRYRAAVRTQSSKVEMIGSLFNPDSDNTGDDIIGEILLDFFNTSGQRKPEQIIIFRDGVSESQFNQVLNIELDQIIKACKKKDEKWCPKFNLIVAQKNHHTRFFNAKTPKENVPPGTIIDSNICHPTNNDFYMYAHYGGIGTSRPTHYHVLLDDIGFSTDNLQELVHSLCYVYQRSTSAISIVAPIHYAHLAAAQMAKFIKFDENDTSSSSSGSQVPELPPLHRNVKDTMFFC